MTQQTIKRAGQFLLWLRYTEWCITSRFPPLSFMEYLDLRGDR